MPFNPVAKIILPNIEDQWAVAYIVAGENSRLSGSRWSKWPSGPGWLGKVLVTPVRRAKEERIRQLVNGIHHKHPIISRAIAWRWAVHSPKWSLVRWAPQKARLGKDAKARTGVDCDCIQFHGHRPSSQARAMSSGFDHGVDHRQLLPKRSASSNVPCSCHNNIRLCSLAL